MTTDIFQGDPHLTLSEQGAEMTFTGGQPVMDTGLENQVNISLFTTSFWGNVLEADPDRKIGSDFETVAAAPLTREQLKIIRNSVIKALKAPVFKKIESFVSVPNGHLNIRNLLTPPSGNEQELLLTTNGQNWISQRDDPAYLK